jgi:hypothetical protein
MKNSILQKPIPPGRSYERFRLCKTRFHVSIGAALCLAFLPATLHAESRFLKANGRDLRSDSGNGEVVTLRGVNLGSLYVYEQWMSPMANSTSPTDQWGVEQLLTTRFGDAGCQQLLNVWRDNWMAPADYDMTSSMNR